MLSKHCQNCQIFEKRNRWLWLCSCFRYNLLSTILIGQVRRQFPWKIWVLSWRYVTKRALRTEQWLYRASYSDIYRGKEKAPLRPEGNSNIIVLLLGIPPIITSDFLSGQWVQWSFSGVSYQNRFRHFDKLIPFFSYLYNWW